MALYKIKKEYFDILSLDTEFERDAKRLYCVVRQLDYKQNSHKYDGVEDVKRQKGDLHKTEFALGLLLDGVFVGGCEIVVHRINLRYYIVNLIILYIQRKINRKADKK